MLRKVLIPTALLTALAIGTQNGAPFVLENVVARAPLASIMSGTIGLAYGSQTVTTPITFDVAGETYYYYRSIAITPHSYSTPVNPLGSMTEQQLETLFNPNGVIAPVSVTGVTVNNPSFLGSLGGTGSAFMTGLLGGFNVFTATYTPTSTDAGTHRAAYAIGSLIRIVSLIGLILTVLIFIKNLVWPMITNVTRRARRGFTELASDVGGVGRHAKRFV